MGKYTDNIIRSLAFNKVAYWKSKANAIHMLSGGTSGGAVGGLIGSGIGGLHGAYEGYKDTEGSLTDKLKGVLSGGAKGVLKGGLIGGGIGAGIGALQAPYGVNATINALSRGKTIDSIDSNVLQKLNNIIKTKNMTPKDAINYFYSSPEAYGPYQTVLDHYLLGFFSPVVSTGKVMSKVLSGNISEAFKPITEEMFNAPINKGL